MIEGGEINAFRIGDKVYAGYDDKCDIYGKIVEIKNGIYYVELLDRGISGGRFAYKKSDLCVGCWYSKGYCKKNKGVKL